MLQQKVHTSIFMSPSSEQWPKLARLLSFRYSLATFAISEAPVGRQLTLISVFPLPSQFRPPMLTALKQTRRSLGMLARLMAK